MAFGMKHWLAVVFLGVGTLAVSQLPPRPLDTRRMEGRVPSQEEVRYRALRDDAIQTRILLRRVRWSDTLPTLLAREADDGWALLVATPPSFPPGPADLLRTDLRQAVDNLPHRRDDILIGAFVERQGERPTGDTWEGQARDVLFGRADGIGYCVNVDVGLAPPVATLRTALTERNPDMTLRRNVLGLCRWIADLGLPGPDIARWLQAGGAAFATEPSVEVSGTSARPWHDWSHRRRGPFGIGWSVAAQDGCLAGIETSCASFFARPREPRTRGPSREGRWRDDDVASPERAWLTWQVWWGNDRWATLVAELYDEFGRERTEAFWTSERDVLPAFQEAFGVDAGSWMAERVRTSATYVPPGPLPRLRATLWALLVMVVCGGIASAAGQRRQVT